MQVCCYLIKAPVTGVVFDGNGMLAAAATCLLVNVMYE